MALTDPTRTVGAVRCPRRTGPTRAMTMIEMVVVLVIMAALMAVSLPRLLGADAMGTDMQAKTTASGVADTLARLYADQQSVRPYDPDLWKAYADAASVDDTGAPVTLTRDDYAALPRVASRPEISADRLQAANPDIRVSGSATEPSDGYRQASVGVRLVEDTGREPYWTVGIAVYAPPSGARDGACWMVRKDFLAPYPSRGETYLVHTFPADQTGQDRCTGQAVADLDVTDVTEDPANSADELVGTGHDDPAGVDATLASHRGSTWSRPLFVTAAHLG